MENSSNPCNFCWDAYSLEINAAWKVRWLLMKRLSTSQKPSQTLIMTQSMDDGHERRSTWNQPNLTLLQGCNESSHLVSFLGSSRVESVESTESYTNFNGNESRNTARVTGNVLVYMTRVWLDYNTALLIHVNNVFLHNMCCTSWFWSPWLHNVKGKTRLKLSHIEYPNNKCCGLTIGRPPAYVSWGS